MEEADIYYVDARNADNRDHRSPGGAIGAPRPRTVVAQPAHSTRIYTVPPQYPQYGPFVPPMSNPYLMQQPTLASNILGRVTAAQVVDLVAQIFAALMPLPSAPLATQEAATDVGNLILYQGALAQYAKRDEQVRTLGNLVTKLLG